MSKEFNGTTTNPLSEFRFNHRLRVRWSEVDLQKVVFNPHYLTYFDVAIAQYWRGLALPYEETLKSLEGDLLVKKASLEYNGSALFDETLSICLRCAKIGRTSMTFMGEIFRDAHSLVKGELIYVFVDAHTRTPKPIPDSLRNLLTNFEDGQDVTYLRLGSWSDLKDDALKIRHDVFVFEQGVPAEIEEDEFDALSVHAVLYNALNLPVATGRLVKDPSLEQHHTSRIGRMAVRRDLRGSYWGSKILGALQEVSKSHGDVFITLHAQVHAKAFYQKHGFKQSGEIFDEAGIPHIEMHKTVKD